MNMGGFMENQYQNYNQSGQNKNPAQSPNFVNPAYQANGGSQTVQNHSYPNQQGRGYGSNNAVNNPYHNSQAQNFYAQSGNGFSQNQQYAPGPQNQGNPYQNMNTGFQPNQNSNYNNQAPVGNLNTSRGLGKFILLSIVTLGIYSIIYYSGISTDINIIASRYDGKKTMHYCLMFFLLGPITLYIFGLVWFNNLSSRIGNELKRRGLNYDFGASDFWLWNVLGSLILVGPFIYIHKLSKAMNLLAQDYNYKG